VGLVRGQTERILRLLDFEEGSRKALRLAILIGPANQGELYLLHISHAVVIPLGGPATEPVIAAQIARQKPEEIAKAITVRDAATL
jgi:hypothetical protein